MTGPSIPGPASGPVPVEPEGPDEVVQGGTRKQIRKEQRRVLFTTPGFIVGMAILVFWVVSAIAPELITDTDPKLPVRDDSGSVIARESPSGEAWFGTDSIGRDVFSRTIHGARPILIVTPIATLIALVAGTLIGLSMGYFRGWVDEVLSRLVESVLSIPTILMAILVVFERTCSYRAEGPCRPVSWPNRPPHKIEACQLSNGC